MERFKDLSQLYKDYGIAKICESGKLEISEFIMEHPNNEDYILASNPITQNANKIHIPKMIEEEYCVGKYDPEFVRTKKIEELEFEIKRLQVLINMLKNEKGLL